MANLLYFRFFHLSLNIRVDMRTFHQYSAAIGYSIEYNNFVNHPLSRTSKVTDIDCLNNPSSVWSNVVYNLTEGTT